MRTNILFVPLDIRDPLVDLHQVEVVDAGEHEI